DVRARADHERRVVAAQHASEPDPDVDAERDVAGERGVRRHVPAAFERAEQTAGRVDRLDPWAPPASSGAAASSANCRPLLSAWTAHTAYRFCVRSITAPRTQLSAKIGRNASTPCSEANTSDVMPTPATSRKFWASSGWRKL